MGTFHWPLTVLSADGDREETVEALVDTGATYTSLPASLLSRLGVSFLNGTWSSSWPTGR